MSQDGLRFEAIDFASTEPDPADALIEKEVREKVLDAIRELPEGLRAPTLLYYFEQLTLREIAAGIGITVANVKVRLHRARLRLRERLLADGLASAATGQSKQEERHAMVQVKVFDVLHRVQRSETGAEQKAPSVVILVDEQRERTLPIWTGRAGAEAIAVAVRNKSTPRPLTASLMATLLRTARVEVKEVRISRLEGTTYYAEVEIISGGRPNVVDARPSDAIALAIHSSAPIYVSDEIMQRASLEIPRAADGVERPPHGIEDVIAEVERSFPPARGRMLGREEADRASQDLVREVFGTQV
jgi:bifunctional DNase/RNase